MGNRELENVLSTQRREIASLRAETFALQAVMTHLAESVVEKPDLRPTLLKAFDDAAAKVAHMSLMREGQASDFLPEALEIIDRFREAFTGAHPEAVRTP